MNKHSKLHKILQWKIAVILFLASFIMAAIWGALTANNFIWFFLIFIGIPLSYVLSMPFFKLLGHYSYLSPMLVASTLSGSQYTLHDGTILDFFIMMKKHKKTKLKAVVLHYYLSGILEIIRRIENGLLPDNILIETSTYLFSDRTIGELGFKKSKPGIMEKMGFVIQYPSLLLMRSLVYKRISFPRLTNIKTMQIEGVELVAKKDTITTICSRIKTRI